MVMCGSGGYVDMWGVWFVAAKKVRSVSLASSFLVFDTRTGLTCDNGVSLPASRQPFRKSDHISWPMSVLVMHQTLVDHLYNVYDVSTTPYLRHGPAARGAACGWMNHTGSQLLYIMYYWSFFTSP